MSENIMAVNEKMANGNMTEAKPDTLPVIPENIPEVLKSQNHWVVFRLVRRGEKWTKPPYDAKTGNDAKVNDSGTWSDFDTALNAYQTGKYDGIGFVLTDDMGIAGFDFDHCIENGEISPEVRSFISILSTYTEKSPSGTGIRAFAFGKLPKGKRKAGPYEVYSGGRYLTVTGHNEISMAKDIMHREKETAEVYRKIFGNQNPEPEPAPDTRKERTVPTDMQSLLEKAFASKCGSEIQTLYNGNWKEVAGCPSQSEADQKLCCHLAYWFDSDSSAIDAAFRSSGLYREKWERKTGSSTYGKMTIDRAVSLTSHTYQDFMRELKSTGEEGNGISDNGKTRKSAQQWMTELNRKHAVVMLRGQLLILNEETDPIHSRADITFSKPGDFKGRYANITVTEKKKTDSLGNYWFKHKNRRSYDGVIFRPQQESENYYNLWTGFGIEPKPGDWSLMKNHVLNVICGGNKEYAKWLLAWFARIVQNPGGERPGTAVVLLGKKGTGKGTFVDQFRHILCNHYMSVSKSEHITGRFNSHLKNLVLLFCDEGFWAGDKNAEGTLKRLITEATNPIELKGQNVFQVDNYVNLVMASNEPWAVPASRDERRYFVLEVSDTYLQKYPNKEDRDREIFKPIWNQMNNGGREAMFHDLLHLDISEVNLSAAPRTQALLDQIERSMSPFEKWWYERLVFGENTGGGWEEAVEISILYNAYWEFASRMGAKYKLSELNFGKEMKKVCPETEIFRPGTSGPRPRHYRFPSLEKCRAEYQKQINIEIKWDSEI